MVKVRVVDFYKRCTHHSHFHADEDVTPPSSEGADTLEIQIRPHPQHSTLNRMAIKNLVTSPACTIAHLLRFIKLNLESEALGQSTWRFMCWCSKVLLLQRRVVH